MEWTLLWRRAVARNAFKLTLTRFERSRVTGDSEVIILVLAPAKEVVLNALSRVAEMDAAQYLEAPECSVGIVAAEVVAALKSALIPICLIIRRIVYRILKSKLILAWLL